MKFTIYGKNMHISDGMKETLKKKFEKFDRYFNKETEVFATFSKEKNECMLEVTIPINRTILRAEERSDDLGGTIEAVIDKLEGQLRKQKTKLQKRYANEMMNLDLDEVDDWEEEAEQSKIVRTKRFAVKPMSAEEAALQMEMLGHSFFMFLNAETDEVNVVYMRKDGNYGLIEPIFD